MSSPSPLPSGVTDFVTVGTGIDIVIPILMVRSAENVPFFPSTEISLKQCGRSVRFGYKLIIVFALTLAVDFHFTQCQGF